MPCAVNATGSPGEDACRTGYLRTRSRSAHVVAADIAAVEFVIPRRRRPRRPPRWLVGACGEGAWVETWSPVYHERPPMFSDGTTRSDRLKSSVVLPITISSWVDSWTILAAADLAQQEVVSTVPPTTAPSSAWRGQPPLVHAAKFQQAWPGVVIGVLDVDHPASRRAGQVVTVRAGAHAARPRVLGIRPRRGYGVAATTADAGAQNAACWVSSSEIAWSRAPRHRSEQKMIESKGYVMKSSDTSTSKWLSSTETS